MEVLIVPDAMVWNVLLSGIATIVLSPKADLFADAATTSWDNATRTVETVELQLVQQYQILSLNFSLFTLKKF